MKVTKNTDQTFGFKWLCSLVISYMGMEKLQTYSNMGCHRSDPGFQYRSLIESSH